MPLRIPICELVGKKFLGSDASSMPDLLNSEAHPTDCRVSDELLMAVSQQYEQLLQQYEAYCTEEKFDELFLEASQLLDVPATIQRFMVKPSGKQQVDVEPLDNPVVVKPSDKQKESRIQKMKTLSAWAQSVLREWTTHRLKQPPNAVSPFAKPLSSATNFTTNPELWTVGLKPVCYCNTLHYWSCLVSYNEV